MEFDFCLEWQNIEYALMESEMITLSEIYTGPVTGNLGRNVSAVGKGAAYVAGIPVVTGGKVMKGVGSVGSKVVGGTVRRAGGMLRNFLLSDTFWSRLIERIQNIWQRFKNVIAAIFKSNQSFVSTELYNAEAVLRNSLSNHRMTGKEVFFNDIYPYWKVANLLYSIQIPRLNTGDQSMMKCLDDKKIFISRYIGSLKNIDFSGSDNGTSAIKQTLRGSAEPIQIGLEEIVANSKSMVEFVQKNSTFVANLNQEKDAILQSARHAESMARQAVNSYQSQENNSFATSYNQGNIELAQRNLKRIQTYISLAQSILGVKETICHEYTNQSINLLRSALKKCQAVTTGEVENTRMRHYISDDQLQDEPVKDYGNPNSAAGKFIAKKKAQFDAAQQLKGKSDENKKEFTLGDREAEYFESLPNSIEELRQEAKRAKIQRDRLIDFLRKRKIRADDPRFIEIKRVIDDYDRRIALLDKKRQNIKD